MYTRWEISSLAPPKITIWTTSGAAIDKNSSKWQHLRLNTVRLLVYCWGLVSISCSKSFRVTLLAHNDVTKWKHFLCYWPFVRGIHRSPVDFPHKGQCCGALMFSVIYTWTNGWKKQSRRKWFETPSRSLWRHCNHMIAAVPMKQHWRIWATEARK